VDRNEVEIEKRDYGPGADRNSRSENVGANFSGLLEQVFAIIEKKPEGKTCAAIVGITDEGAEIMEEYKGSPELDAGLLASAQAVEHYEISRYGTLRTWAEELGFNDAASLLQATLDEEKTTDQTLTKIAESAINQDAEAA
jgi:ferritin-like metal-binding protein YciE